MDKIGLFPLNIVMFPGSSVPLHIFEPRYKQLINSAVEKNLVFGMNFVDSSRLYQIGCAVEVSEVVQRYPDGQLDIIITGTQRYTLHSLREGEELYYMGFVEYFEDISEPELDASLLYECKGLYNEIAGIVYPAIGPEVLLTDLVPPPVSFFIAQKAGLENARKQELLEMRSETQRLTTLREFMTNILPDLRQKKRIEEVIMSDGYLPRRSS